MIKRELHKKIANAFFTTLRHDYETSVHVGGGASMRWHDLIEGEPDIDITSWKASVELHDKGDTYYAILDVIERDGVLTFQCGGHQMGVTIDDSGAVVFDPQYLPGFIAHASREIKNKAVQLTAAKR
jgi:hypothetical protein